MTSISSVPFEVIDKMFAILSQHDLAMISATCSNFNVLANRRLYRSIVIVNEEDVKYFSMMKNGFSHLSVTKLESLATCLSLGTIGWIESIDIFAQSEGNPRSYEVLFSKLYNLWETSFSPIRFTNYDLASMRYRCLINQYILVRLGQYWEDECHHIQTNNKLERLSSLLIQSKSEWCSMPRNPSLARLDVFVERGLTISLPLNSLIPVMANLMQISLLYLHTPAATRIFLESVVDLEYPLCLQTFQFTTSHAVCAESSLLDFGVVSRAIDLNAVDRLELKANCMRPGCSCIQSFFSDWITHNAHQCASVLELALVNYKSCALKANMAQYASIVNAPAFFALFSRVRSFHINIYELGLPSNHGVHRDVQFNIEAMTRNLQYMTDLLHLTVPDFLTHWQSWVPDQDIEQDETNESEWFDNMLNKCFCLDCNRGRLRFRRLAKYMTRTNYCGADEHKLGAVVSTTSLTSLILNPTLEYNEMHVSFFNYLVLQFKRSFRIQHKNLFAINSVLDAKYKPLVIDPAFDVFARLLWHNYIGIVALKISLSAPLLQSLNLGGIRAHTNSSLSCKML